MLFRSRIIMNECLEIYYEDYINSDDENWTKQADLFTLSNIETFTQTLCNLTRLSPEIRFVEILRQIFINSIKTELDKESNCINNLSIKNIINNYQNIINSKNIYKYD